MTWLAHLVWILHLSGAYPVLLCYRANRQTTLSHALGWASAAWLSWLLADLAAAFPLRATDPTLHYLALCLTGCAGVAVLGARRPGVAAWNFVLVGLLAVLLLQIAEGIDRLRESPMRELFVAGTFAVGILNYLPTRLSLGAFSLAGGCALELFRLLWPDAGGAATLLWGGFLVALSPWLALGGLRLTNRGADEFDRTWLDFRDRFGFVWGQRMREQFNQSASHAGWRAYLRWHGVRSNNGPLDVKTQAAMLATLHALLKRFGPEPRETSPYGSGAQ
jgi:hypothetical protein